MWTAQAAAEYFLAYMILTKVTLRVQTSVRGQDAPSARQIDVIGTGEYSNSTWRGAADFPDRNFEMAKAFDLDSSPGHLLRRAQQYCNDLYTNEKADGKLTQRQFAVLFAVDQHDGVSQTDLVAMTGIDRSTLADMIVRLQGKDFLARKRTDEDQRANSVRITTNGRKMLRSSTPAIQRSDAQILEALPARARAEFLKCLMLIAKAGTDTQLAAEEDGRKAKGRKRR
jgi:DNA-binding MarR family transcriptional regulator